MRMRWGRWPLLLLQMSVLLLSSIAVQAATPHVTASLNRHTIGLDDTVTLTVTIAGSTQGARPDFSALDQDFRVLDTERASSMQIVNGQRSASLQWSLTLQPRHAGTLHIPPLKVNGAHTRALTLTVKAASPQARGVPGDPVFVQATPSTDTPYVGQQVTLDVKLFYAVSLANGSLGQPGADGLDVRQLGHDQHSREQRHGREYHVVERKFALFAQHAGDIRVAGIDFKGQAVDNAGVSGFFTQEHTVRARSAAFTLHVRKPPAKAGSPWVPARNLTLTLQGVPKSGKVQVGEPLTLTLTELAVGVPFESLPKPTLPTLQGAQIYPDKPQGKTSNDSPWLIGKRSRSFAVVPTHAGTLTIPRITLNWWDVVKNQQETASIPAHTFTVVAAPGTVAANPRSNAAAPGTSSAGAASTAAAPAAAASMARSATTSAIAPPASSTAGSWWRWLALVGIGLWLLTAAAVVLVLFWLRARRRRLTRDVSPDAPASKTGRSRLRNAFLVAVRSGDVDAQARTLLAWVQSERPHIAHLGALHAALGDARQRAVVDALQRRRFSNDASEVPDGNQVAALFRSGLRWKTAPNETSSPLPPLYPES